MYVTGATSSNRASPRPATGATSSNRAIANAIALAIAIAILNSRNILKSQHQFHLSSLAAIGYVWRHVFYNLKNPIGNDFLGGTAIVNIERASELMWSEDVSDHERFGGADGEQRVDMIKTMYGAADHPFQNKPIPFFIDGKRTIWKHIDNQRNNKAHHDKLVASIRKNGLLWGGRGEAWIVVDEMNTFTLWSIASGSLLEAAYTCFERYKHEPNVKRALERGVRGGFIFVSKTPRSIIVWLKNFHNQFNTGHGCSVIDWLVEWPMLVVAWKNKARHEGIASTDALYQQKMLTCYNTSASQGIRDHMGGWSWINEVNVVQKYIQQHDLLDELSSYYDKHASVDPAKVQNNSDILKVWYSVKHVCEKFVPYPP